MCVITERQGERERDNEWLICVLVIMSSYLDDTATTTVDDHVAYDIYIHTECMCVYMQIVSIGRRPTHTDTRTYIVTREGRDQQPLCPQPQPYSPVNQRRYLVLKEVTCTPILPHTARHPA